MVLNCEIQDEVPVGQCKHLFDRFYRIDEESKKAIENVRYEVIEIR